MTYAPSQPEPPAPAQPQRSSARGWLFEIVETVVLTVLIFLGVQTFVAQPFQIQQHSMETTLLPGQYVLVDKLTPRWAPYERGDIVVLQSPELAIQPGAEPLIKRVIGLPGETVELRDGRVVVDGKVLDEPYVFLEDDGTPQLTEPTGPQSTWVVPEGEVFLLGDHRGQSRDSRSFGPVAIDTLVGRAWLRYWPFDAFGVLTAPDDAADATAG
ncbi:MAG TPA: signal peptidase I [Candidatus Binatia bacterium]|nr:signal peptidase I [Candidatus Binatia bacterium]